MQAYPHIYCSESARILGVDFMSVLTRGSQFKVESIMFRIAKQENYILISPSKEQVSSVATVMAHSLLTILS